MDRLSQPQRQYPHLRVEGSPRERGRQYGEQARERIMRSREAYEQVFAHQAGWDWQRVTQEALRFREPIWQFSPAIAEELRGMAEGSTLPPADILALNVRTEIMYAAKARQALTQAGPGPQGSVQVGPGPQAYGSSDSRGPAPGGGRPSTASGAWDTLGAGERPGGRGECTAVAALSGVTAGGHVIVAQNWDWLLHAYDTVVVLEAHQNGKPDYVTVVEAGLLAKTGMNSAGLGLVTNALVSTGDLGQPGVPHHVLLRGILDASTVTDALVAVQTATRSSSANFMIASADGIGLDIEAASGGLGQLSVLQPSDERLVHTNHFLSPPPGVTDLSLWAMPDSAARLQQARRLAAQAGLLSPSTVMDMLTDHTDSPFSICSHPDKRQVPPDQSATIASIVMDVTSRRMWLSDGPPCEVPYRELDYTDVLSKGRDGRPRERTGLRIAGRG